MDDVRAVSYIRRSKQREHESEAWPAREEATEAAMMREEEIGTRWPENACAATKH